MNAFFKFLLLLIISPIILGFSSVHKKVVIIDVGHGGADEGTIYEGFKEKQITLNIALKIKSLNTNPHLEIILTRDDDQLISLKDRAEFINRIKPDYVISLHTNAHQKTHQKGMEVYLNKESNAYDQAQNLTKKLTESFSNDKIKVHHSKIALLNQVDYPITILEIGYLSNEEDRTYITSDQGQDEIAEWILTALN